MSPEFNSPSTEHLPKEVLAIQAAGAANNVYKEEEIKAAGYSLLDTIESKPGQFALKDGTLTLWGIQAEDWRLLFIYTGVHYHYGAMVRKKDSIP